MNCMARILCWLGLCAATLMPHGADAQTGAEPQLIFSFYGGVAKGPDVYRIPRQPLFLLFQTDLHDTLRLTRNLTTAPTVGMTASLFQSSGFGLAAEIAYVGLRIDDFCQMVFERTDPQLRNRQGCNDISSRTLTVSNVGITLGGAYRLWARNPVTPYARVQGGIGIRSTSIVETIGRYNAVGIDGVVRPTDRVIILDNSDVVVRPFFVAAIGVTLEVARGYQIRAEIRDHLMRLERPTGPANDLAQVNTEGFWGHAPALVFGFDIVLQQKRGRRY